MNRAEEAILERMYKNAEYTIDDLEELTRSQITSRELRDCIWTLIDNKKIRLTTESKLMLTNE